MSSQIGSLNEKPLHAALKQWYAEPGDERIAIVRFSCSRTSPFSNSSMEYCSVWTNTTVWPSTSGISK